MSQYLTTELSYVAAGLAGGLALGLLVALFVWRAARRRIQLLDSEVKHQQHLEAEREQLLKLATESMSSTFGRLASEHFQSHSETLLRLAKENLGAQHEKAHGELAARELAIENLLKPIRETLAKTESRLEQLDKSGRETHGSIKAQLEAVAASQHALSTETRNLVSALRRPEVRGQWGELTLRRLVELAGMVEHCDFVTQSHRSTESGAVRPDMIVNLPDKRQLVVDVKTPLDAYLEATEADSEAARTGALARHATIVAGRIRELSSKAYWAQFERSPEFVILFIPGDQFLSAALAERPALLDDALRQNIILATPSSLVALLKAVAYGWQQVQLAENAAEIRELAVQLYGRLTTFSQHLTAMGKALSDSVKAFNRGIGSLERMVLPGARKFKELGVSPREDLPSLKPVEDTPREPTVDGSGEDDDPARESSAR